MRGMPGAILLVRTPRGEFLGSAGYADMKRDIPMRTEHAIQIGSITKSVVGIVSAQMHAEGILNLDTCITNWLGPELTAHFPHADQVTLRHLLEHTSGFRDFGTDFRRNLSRGFLDRHGGWDSVTTSTVPIRAGLRRECATGRKSAPDSAVASRRKMPGTRLSAGAAWGEGSLRPPISDL